jgi:hypothetical protein
MTKSDAYSAKCGTQPKKTDTPTYINNWWKCACTLAESRGVCSSSWWDWWGAVKSDVNAEEGSTGYYGQSEQHGNGNYIEITMGAPPNDLYLGSFKWVCEEAGDITRVTLDDKTLPENGTLDWVLNDEAAVRVYFKNAGNVASPFTVTVSYNGTTIGTFTTGSVPADGSEYYIDCGTFMPDKLGTHIVSTHIEP